MDTLVINGIRFKYLPAMRNLHLLLILCIGLKHASCDLRPTLDVDGIENCPSVTSVSSETEDTVENAQLLHPNHLDSLDPVELRSLVSLERARAERAIKRAKISDARAERAIEGAKISDARAKISDWRAKISDWRANISDARAELAIKRSEGGYFLQLCNLSTEFKNFSDTSYKEYVQNFNRSEFYKLLPDNSKNMFRISIVLSSINYSQTIAIAFLRTRLPDPSPYVYEANLYFSKHTLSHRLLRVIATGFLSFLQCSMILPNHTCRSGCRLFCVWCCSECVKRTKYRIPEQPSKLHKLGTSTALSGR